MTTKVEDSASHALSYCILPKQQRRSWPMRRTEREPRQESPGAAPEQSPGAWQSQGGPAWIEPKRARAMVGHVRWALHYPCVNLLAPLARQAFDRRILPPLPRDAPQQKSRPPALCRQMLPRCTQLQSRADSALPRSPGERVRAAGGVLPEPNRWSG